MIIDTITETFTFKDINILKYINRLKEIYLSEETTAQDSERKPENKSENKVYKTKIERKVYFSALQFGNGSISIIYKKRRYIYKDVRIKNYDKTIKDINLRASKAGKDFINTSVLWVIIDIEAGTFAFKNEDIHKYINDLKEVFLLENNQAKKTNRIRLVKAARELKVSIKTIIEFLAKKGFQIDSSPTTKLTAEMYALLVKEFRVDQELPQEPPTPPTPPTTRKTTTIGTGNVRFYDGYYLIFQTTNGEIDHSIAPLRVDDPDSHEILNLVHKYFEQKLEEKHIIVKLDDAKIVEPSKIELFQLKNYVRYLNQNLDAKGGWWEEVQNYRKPSLKQCRSISEEDTKKKVSLKNGYLDSLVSMQSEIKLIPVYEINHGKEEAAFIFSINMPNDRCAVIFENASNSAATTTWIFVTKIENYEQCINMVFDYFTDYTLFTKRSSLRVKTVNPPEKYNVPIN